jgi:hypothetical protein
MTYLVSTGGDYLVLNQGEMLTTTKNIEDATPISIKKEIAPTSNVIEYVLMNADGTSYISCDWSVNRSSSRVMYSKIPILGNPGTLALRSLVEPTSVSIYDSGTFLILDQPLASFFYGVPDLTTSQNVLVWKLVSQ